ncbi:MAG: cupin domain-containing protein [Bacteroidales bacterium]
MQKQNLKQYQKFKNEKFQKKHVFTSDYNKTFVLNLLPGQEIPTHTHEGYELQITVLRGKGKVRVNHEEELFSEGDILKCDAKDKFSLINCSQEKLTCLAILFKV